MRMVRNARRGAQADTRSEAGGPAEIAQVAYELFERRGSAHGQDQRDWFEAERIVRQRARTNQTH